jgi:predicted MFS family arabinose efflux permease
LRNRTFAVLFAAEMQSLVGDQIARVALSVLAFDRTHSALAAAGTYAATMIPSVIGGLVLSRVGDHVPRRTVMIVVASISAACFVGMAVPGVPLASVVALLVLAVALGPVFSAAELSHLSVTLLPEQYRVGTAARMMTSQAAQVTGFAFGGLLVAAIGPRLSLLADAGTFAVSAVLIATLLSAAAGRPAGADRGSAEQLAAERDSAQFAGLLRTPRLRVLLLLGSLIGFFVVPEGLAVPFGRSVGASTADIGILLGAAAFGGALGSVLMVRLVPPERRRSAARLMAVACGVPLVVSGFVGHWPVAAVCWLVSGGFAAYMLEVATALIQAVPAQRRSHYAGVINTVVLASQGLGMLVFGAVSTGWAPGTAIALAGAVGSGLAVLVPLAAPRRARRRGEHRIERISRPEVA